MSLVHSVLAALRGDVAGAIPHVDVCVDGEPVDGFDVTTIDLARPDGRPAQPGILAVVDRMADIIAAAVQELPPAEEIPAGWMMDSQGRLVRLENVREQDRLRDEVARGLALEGLVLNRLLAAFKSRALEDMAELVRTSAAEYGVDLGGEKGNLTISTFDGSWRVQRVYRDVISFTEQILAAKELIDACITRWSEGADPHIRALIDRAFRAGKKGDLRTGPVLELLRLKIDDPDWQTAMQALADSIDITGSAVYVRVQRRAAADQYVPIPIDLAAV